jgi:hypothetical protein
MSVAAYMLPEDTSVQQLLAANPGPDRFVCVHLPAGSPFGDVARRVECAVFGEWFGNTPEVMAEAYGPHEATSAFLLVLDRELGVAAGALRYLPGGGKTLPDVSALLGIPEASILTRHGISVALCVDIATLAVPKPYRRSGVSLTLYARLYTEAVAAGIAHGVTILDDHAYQQLVSLGVALEPICGSEPFSYLGSAKSRATVIEVQKTHLASSASPAARTQSAERTGQTLHP